MQKHNKIVKWVRVLAISASLVCVGNTVFAQTEDSVAEHAQGYLDAKEYDKAIELYKGLYEKEPNKVYGSYLIALISKEKYKDAEKLVNRQIAADNQNFQYYIDLSKVFQLEKKDQKANDELDYVLKRLNGDDMVTQQIGNAFITAGRVDYAIKTYEIARKLTGNSYLYGQPLAMLYAKAGNIDSAVNILLGSNPGQYVNPETTKATLLQMIGEDATRLQQAQKAIVKKINEHPENIYYAELITWIYTQKNDWDGALLQIEALDERNTESGQRLLNFAHTAENAKAYETASKAYDDVIAKGKDSPFYATAKSEKTHALFQQLKNNPAFTTADVAVVRKAYDTLLNEFPRFYANDAGTDYAMLEAQFADNPQRGIEILNNVISQPDAKKQFVGRAKLQLGDYYLLTGKIWDASLTYSQVDKEFKEDILGEEARYRNAKLAYYRGDFKWAQGQLNVLKASTSELIANDALYLSVVITENTPDSITYPLERFAYADLLLFQNKDSLATQLLDSISTAFPKHALNDDILMLRARIAEKHRDYTKEMAFLTAIYDQYKDDVLADDAVFMMAEINQKYLNKIDEAKKYYEQLIIEYPGSTFVQTARQRLNLINNPVLP